MDTRGSESRSQANLTPHSLVLKYAESPWHAETWANQEHSKWAKIEAFCHFVYRLLSGPAPNTHLHFTPCLLGAAGDMGVGGELTGMNEDDQQIGWAQGQVTGAEVSWRTRRRVHLGSNFSVTADSANR